MTEMSQLIISFELKAYTRFELRVHRSICPHLYIEYKKMDTVIQGSGYRRTNLSKLEIIDIIL